MTSTSTEKVVWTVSDLEHLPDDGCHYEIIDGDLFVTRAPHWKHQTTTSKIASVLIVWSDGSKLGEAAANPGLIFSETDAVIPDVVWASFERLNTLMDAAGHLVAAPELVVEVLSPGAQNEQRDRETKLKLYSTYGVLEYWIADREQQKLEVYRRDSGLLKLACTLYATDEITSPILPEFRAIVGQFF